MRPRGNHHRHAGENGAAFAARRDGTELDAETTLAARERAAASAPVMTAACVRRCRRCRYACADGPSRATARAAAQRTSSGSRRMRGTPRARGGPALPVRTIAGPTGARTVARWTAR
ncbi:MAG: hypothetical protein WDW36_003385 [Sanguina aurantia]